MNDKLGKGKHTQHHRNYFLTDIPLDRAKEIQAKMLRDIGFADRKSTESVPLDLASGRIVSQGSYNQLLQSSKAFKKMVEG